MKLLLIVLFCSSISSYLFASESHIDFSEELKSTIFEDEFFKYFKKVKSAKGSAFQLRYPKDPELALEFLDTLPIANPEIVHLDRLSIDRSYNRQPILMRGFQLSYEYSPFQLIINTHAGAYSFDFDIDKWVSERFANNLTPHLCDSEHDTETIATDQAVEPNYYFERELAPRFSGDLNKAAAQQRILQLWHARRCRSKNDECRVSQCQTMKRVWEHIVNCTNPKCQESHCVSSRRVFRHYQKCNETNCDICPPVREYIQRSEIATDQIKNQQARLLLLRHAAKCKSENDECLVTPHCQTMKQLWKHIAQCSNPECDENHCLSSRYILSHYKECKDYGCKVCAPVRNALLQSGER